MTKTLETMWAALTVGGRLNPEKSRAVESYKYGRDPATFVQFGKKREVEVDRQSNQEIADSLLIEWYRWCKTWRPALGHPRAIPGYTDHRGKHEDEKNKAWESISSYGDEDEEYAKVHQREMEAVDFCVGSLAVPMQQAIGTEMKNREVKQKVWRDRSNKTFEQALYAVIPHMRRHRDLMALFN